MDRQTKSLSIEETLWEMAKSIERIEHALLPTDFNGKRGLVMQVKDLEERVDSLEEYRIKQEEIQTQKEASRKKRNEIITIAATIVGLVVAVVTTYLTVKK